MNKRGYLLLDTLIWCFLGVVIMVAVLMSINNLVRHMQYSRSSMVAMSSMSVLDLAIMNDLEQGSVLVLSGDGLIINEVNYELDDGVLLRDNREIFAGEYEFKLEGNYLEAIFTYEDYLMERIYYIGGG